MIMEPLCSDLVLAVGHDLLISSEILISRLISVMVSSGCQPTQVSCITGGLKQPDHSTHYATHHATLHAIITIDFIDYEKF